MAPGTYPVTGVMWQAIRVLVEGSSTDLADARAFGYSDPAMEEALYGTTILRQFAGLSLERIPDETTILNFRRLLEKHELAAGILAVINGYLGDRGLSLRQGTIVDATLINAPSSTKTRTASATRKCTRPRRETSITSA